MQLDKIILFVLFLMLNKITRTKERFIQPFGCYFIKASFLVLRYTIKNERCKNLQIMNITPIGFQEFFFCNNLLLSIDTSCLIFFI